VIDARQSDPQANVIQALRGMGYTEQADRYTHFSYEMVALTPRCAVELGYDVSAEDLARPYIEVSGRKGFGVKADDLIDKLIAATRAEVEARQTGRDEAERQKIAEQIAIGALRYFMLKFTRNSVIAFDFKDALSFEGETGPYIQYAVVRARNIFRKAGTTPEAVLAEFGAAHGGAVDLSVARRTRISGRCGCGPRGALWCLTSASQAQSRRTWPNMLPTGAGVQQFLPPPSHSNGRGRGQKSVSAGHRCRRAARTGDRARVAWHRKP